MRNGIYTGISNADYHSDKDSYSSSLIKLMGVPAMAKHYMDTPQQPKECFRIGSAIHKYILEPDDFFKEFLLGIDTPRRSKDNKREWANWFSGHGADGYSIIEGPAATWNPKFEQQTGRHMVRPEEIETIKLMAKAISDDPDSLRLITSGEAESSIYWTDKKTSQNLRIRPDYLSERTICDLKSIESVDDKSITRAFANLGYGISAAMYQEGVFETQGIAKPFIFLFVQKSAPYMTRVIQLNEVAQLAYADKYQQLKCTLADCIAADYWPGYDNDLEFNLPDWAI